MRKSSGTRGIPYGMYNWHSNYWFQKLYFYDDDIILLLNTCLQRISHSLMTFKFSKIISEPKSLNLTQQRQN